ncbi:MAG: alpha/beta hydrolase [Pseudomonadota bacterium]
MNPNTVMIATMLAISSVGPTIADQVDGATFRSIEEGQWYHPIELEMWAHFGADQDRTLEILTRIETATGHRSNPSQPDTISTYGAGNWTYEFTRAGDEGMARAERVDGAARLAVLKEALTYYHTASAPHTEDANRAAALEGAYAAYEEAARMLPGTFRTVEIDLSGKQFSAFLHLPEGDGPHPVLVFSNGSDMSRVTALNYYETYLLPKEIGFLTIEIPGMGHSARFDVTDGQTEKLHVAAVNWARTQRQIDTDNIFVQGVSFGGNAAARVWSQHEDLDLAGVIYTCGPLHSVFMAPAEAYDTFPEFTIDGVKTRLGLPTESTSADFASSARILSIESVDAFEGDMINTPMLAINTHADPVAPLQELDSLLERGRNVERVVFHLEGHCPPHDQREAIVSSWIERHLQ